MKKTVVLLLTLALGLAIFAGCTQAGEQPEFQEKGCRAEGMKDDGMVVYMSGVGTVWIQHPSRTATGYTTFFVEFSPSDLREETGTFLDFAGTEREYTYVLEHVRSMRDPAPGEPTFS